MKKLSRIALAVGSVYTAAQLSAGAVLAQSPLGGTTVETGTGWATDFGKLISAVLTFVMVVAALLVFLYLILGGIEWITSGGDKGKTEQARNKITAAVIGLIVLAASYAVLTLALKFLGFNDLNDVFNKTKTIQ